jgi:hypothetical protein
MMIDVVAAQSPAHGALVLRSCLLGYESRNDQGMPLALAFLVLPLLTKPTSHDPFHGTNAATGFVNFLSRNQWLLVGFPGRVRRLRGYSRASLLFGGTREVVTFSGGRLWSGKGALLREPKYTSRTPAGRDHSVAKRLGTWWASGPSVETVFSALGVAP